MVATPILTEVLEQLHRTRGQVERLQDLLLLLKPKTYNQDPRASAALVRRAVKQIRRARAASGPGPAALYPSLPRFAPVDFSLQAERARGVRSAQRISTTIRPSEIPIIVDRVLKTFRFTKTQLAVATGVPKTMIRKWETRRVTTDIPVRLQELDDLREELESRLASEEVKRWLRTPNDAFGNEPPKDWLLDGRARVVKWVFVRMPTPDFRKMRERARKKRRSSASPLSDK